MAWTTPRTWVANELVTAAMMNTHVRDNLNVLDMPLCWIDYPGQTVNADGNFRSWNTGSGTTALIDTRSMFVNHGAGVGASGAAIKIPSTGKYLVVATQFSGNAGTIRVVVAKAPLGVYAGTVHGQAANDKAGADLTVYAARVVDVLSLVATDEIYIGGSATGGGTNTFQLGVIRLPQ